MTKIISTTEHFQQFLTDPKGSFWDDLEAKTRQAWMRFLEAESERRRNLHVGYESYEYGPWPASGCNGHCERDFVTSFGALRLRIAHARGKRFLPPLAAATIPPWSSNWSAICPN